MSNDDDFGFAPPPFNPGDALQRARRDLRALGLVEREGRYERGGTAIAKLSIDGATLAAAIVVRPSRHSPEWVEKTLKDSAALRDWIAALKHKLGQWNDRDD